MTDFAEALLAHPHLPAGVGLIALSIFLFGLCLRTVRLTPQVAGRSGTGSRPPSAGGSLIASAGAGAAEIRPAKSGRRQSAAKARGANGPLSAYDQRGMDLTVTKDGLELTLELPGLDENDLEIKVADGVLTITGEIKVSLDRKGRNHPLVDRGKGAFTRSIQLPAGVRTERIRASLHQGLLRVAIPKPTPPEPGRVFVNGGPMRLTWTPEAMEVTMDLPGVQQEDIQVVVSQNVLTVSGSVSATIEGNGGPPIAGDQARGGFSRSFKLPWGVNADQISALVRMGVLKVTIPAPARYDFKKIDVRRAA